MTQSNVFALLHRLFLGLGTKCILGNPDSLRGCGASWITASSKTLEQGMQQNRWGHGFELLCPFLSSVAALLVVLSYYTKEKELILQEKNGAVMLAASLPLKPTPLGERERNQMELVAVMGSIAGCCQGVKWLVDLVWWLRKRRRERKKREEEIGLMRAWVEAMGKVKTRPFIRC